MLSRILLVFAPLLLISCQHNENYEWPDKAEILKDYRFDWVLLEGTQSIRVSLVNLQIEPLCFDSSFWPDQNGDMHYAKDVMEIVVNGSVYQFIDENLGYPSGSFDAHLPAKGEISSIVPLANFMLPNNVSNFPIDDVKYNNIIYFCEAK